MCSSPITLRVDNAQGLRTIQVPCGKCCECLKTYQNDWMCRLYEESTNWNKMLFFTLTYNEDKVPLIVDTSSGECWRSLCKEHVQKWFKRFRISQDRSGHSKSFSYFVCGEYGPRTRRPHYHGLIFGLSALEFWPALKEWEKLYGFTSYSIVNCLDNDAKVKSARYIAKYCSKGVFENPDVLSGHVQKSFRIMSKGIGKSYIVKYKRFHLGLTSFPIRERVEKIHHNRITYSYKFLEHIVSLRRVKLPTFDFSFHMPRYYSEKIYGTKNTLSAQITDFLCKKHGEIFNRKLAEVLSSNCGWSLSQAFRFIYQQENSDTAQRESVARSSLARFYDCSFI